LDLLLVNTPHLIQFLYKMLYISKSAKQYQLFKKKPITKNNSINIFF
jgi:hypothetical protein